MRQPARGSAASVKKPLRVAVLTSHPIQYFAPLYAHLNRDPSLEVTALYCGDFSLHDGMDPGFRRPVTWDIDLLEGYPYVFVGTSGKEGAPGGFWSLICPRLWSEIRSGKYNAVWLHGYNYAAHVVAFAAARSKRLPVLMRSETHLGLHRRAWRRRSRDAIVSVLYRFVDAFLAIGSANRAYYRALGIPEHKIFPAPYAVDNARFSAATALTADARAALRRRYGLPIDDAVVLYASKLVRRKHPDAVLRAVSALRAAGHAVTLFVVGTGELEEELHTLAARGAPGAVVFGGFINQRELPDVYAASDIFTLPAEDEPWGLAVNEAMCAALPVVISNQLGCAADLLREGVNGYTVPPGDVASLRTALERLLIDGDQRRRMGNASRSIVSNWSYENCRIGITAALASVCNSSWRDDDLATRGSTHRTVR